VSPPSLLHRSLVAVLLAVIGVAGAAGSAAAAGADVVAAKATCDALGFCRFDVTLRHPDTGWDHFADRWEVVAEGVGVLGTRVLRHPHVDEQPFTRSLGGVEVPAATKTVRIRARCSVDGWGGHEMEIAIPRRERPPKPPEADAPER
jgi:hypothetical protein